MDIVIEQATLLYPDHKYHGQKVTIRVVDGKIVSIDQKKINTPDKITGKSGEKKIGVRLSAKGEKLPLLDGTTITDIWQVFEA